MITANSFMKREFGKKLIEEFFPKIDLTHVVDTSGAYIPGHGTPTVILFGRNRKPVGDTVRAVLGIKGEPSTPDDASQGFVWQSIVDQIDRAGAQDEFTSTADVPRTTFATHPWSIGGGGAADLKEQLEDECEHTLGDVDCRHWDSSRSPAKMMCLYIDTRRMRRVRLGSDIVVPLVDRRRSSRLAQSTADRCHLPL